MFAARDQENLVHGHQTAAASKSLNQSTRQHAPKTPGKQIPKTPFKIPINDENAIGARKTKLKGNAGGNENIFTGGKGLGAGDKTSFVTPLGVSTRSRLPRSETTDCVKDHAIEHHWEPKPPMQRPKLFRFLRHLP